MKDQKDRKGMNNKGFSFVELIIAIAILAIMAGVLAPQLIKYIDSSRKSTDVQNAQAIATAVNIALANEKAYNRAKATAGTGSSGYNVTTCTNTGDDFQQAVASVIGANMPTPKYNSNIYNDFAIVLKDTGTSLLFYIYPHNNSDDFPDPTESANKAIELYPNVGTNYTN